MERFYRQMSSRSRRALAAVIMSLGVVTLALGGPTASSAAPAEKVTICHATGSLTNPYVEITVSQNAVEAHQRHQDSRDIVPAPATGCVVVPTTVEPPTTSTTSTTMVEPPFVPCVVSEGVEQTATTVTGTPADDTIDCSAASPGKTIDGLAGNDTITATQFDDIVTGGEGNDSITGLGGDDTLSGNAGNDTISGGEGNDIITGGEGNDTLSGEGGNDFVDGGDDDDVLSGGTGVNILIGGPGTDTCDGGPCTV